MASIPHAQSQGDAFRYNWSNTITSDVQLPPVPQPVGIFDPFIARQTETLILKEQISLSGDDFDICLASGQPLIRVDGRVMSISGRKKVYDISGKYLFDIYKRHLHLHTTYHVENDEQQQRLMEVKSSFKLVGSKATATFTSRDGRPVSLVMTGNWMSSNADIIDESTGAPVARIDRKMRNFRELMASKQTYALIVAPGVDMALMCALCICLDEKKNESSGSGG